MEVRKGTPIKIQLRTEIFQENQKSDYSFDLNGQFVQMKDTVYIRYQEQLEGVAELVPVTLKLELDESIQLLRGGSVKMRLKFVNQESRESSYQTEYGMMQLTTVTKSLSVCLEENPLSGEIRIDYDLFAGNEKLGVYHLELDYRG